MLAKNSPSPTLTPSPGTSLHLTEVRDRPRACALRTLPHGAAAGGPGNAASGTNGHKGHAVCCCLSRCVSAQLTAFRTVRLCAGPGVNATLKLSRKLPRTAATRMLFRNARCIPFSSPYKNDPWHSEFSASKICHLQPGPRERLQVTLTTKCW